MIDVPCPHCGHGHPYEITTRNRLKCRHCLKQYSVKSAGAYRCSKLSLKAIQAIRQHMIDQPRASILNISRVYKLSYRGAYSIVTRIRQNKDAT